MWWSWGGIEPDAWGVVKCCSVPLSWDDLFSDVRLMSPGIALYRNFRDRSVTSRRCVPVGWRWLDGSNWRSDWRRWPVHRGGVSRPPHRIGGSARRLSSARRWLAQLNWLIPDRGPPAKDVSRFDVILLTSIAMTWPGKSPNGPTFARTRSLLVAHPAQLGRTSSSPSRDDLGVSPHVPPANVVTLGACRCQRHRAERRFAGPDW